MTSLRVGYIIGSLSARSINRRLVAGLIALARERDQGEEPVLDFFEIPIDQLDLYNYDRDDAYPAAAVALKDAIAASDAVLIATPEYNRSIPGALKNALDWASRPYGQNAFAGKPVGIVGASPGAPGTSMAQQHLRNVLAYLEAPTLTQPEAYIQFTDERFADDGTVEDPTTREFLGDWLTAFRDWIGRVGADSARTLVVSGSQER